MSTYHSTEDNTTQRQIEFQVVKDTTRYAADEQKSHLYTYRWFPKRIEHPGSKNDSVNLWSEMSMRDDITGEK